MRISDWSSDVCSSDRLHGHENLAPGPGDGLVATDIGRDRERRIVAELVEQAVQAIPQAVIGAGMRDPQQFLELPVGRIGGIGAGETYDVEGDRAQIGLGRSEEHTSELQSLMRISYAVFCLKKKNKNKTDYSYVRKANIYYIAQQSNDQ